MFIYLVVETLVPGFDYSHQATRVRSQVIMSQSRLPVLHSLHGSLILVVGIPSGNKMDKWVIAEIDANTILWFPVEQTGCAEQIIITVS